MTKIVNMSKVTLRSAYCQRCDNVIKLKFVSCIIFQVCMFSGLRHPSKLLFVSIIIACRVNQLIMHIMSSLNYSLIKIVLIIVIYEIFIKSIINLCFKYQQVFFHYPMKYVLQLFNINNKNV